MLGWVLNHRGTTWLVFAATLALTVVLYLFIPKGFFPVQDTGTLQATTEADQSISFAGMAERQQAVAERLLQDPAVRSVSSSFCTVEKLGKETRWMVVARRVSGCRVRRSARV